MALSIKNDKVITIVPPKKLSNPKKDKNTTNNISNLYICKNKIISLKFFFFPFGNILFFVLIFLL